MSPIKFFSKTDLPPPLRPMMTSVSPTATSSSMPRRISSRSIFLRKSRTEIMAPFAPGETVLRPAVTSAAFPVADIACGVAPAAVPGVVAAAVPGVVAAAVPGGRGRLSLTFIPARSAQFHLDSPFLIFPDQERSEPSYLQCGAISVLPPARRQLQLYYQVHLEPDLLARGPVSRSAARDGGS